MLTNGIEPFNVRYTKEIQCGLRQGKTYQAIWARSKFGNTEMLCILDESGEEYAYPATWFEIEDRMPEE
jgi:hypothetical protein